ACAQGRADPGGPLLRDDRRDAGGGQLLDAAGLRPEDGDDGAAPAGLQGAGGPGEQRLAVESDQRLGPAETAAAAGCEHDSRGPVHSRSGASERASGGSGRARWSPRAAGAADADGAGGPGRTRKAGARRASPRAGGPAAAGGGGGPGRPRKAGAGRAGPTAKPRGTTRAMRRDVSAATPPTMPPPTRVPA